MWASGQALIHHRGTPSIGLIFLFAAGGVVAWGSLRILSRGASDATGLQMEGSPHLARAGAIHVAAIGSAVGIASLIGMIPSGVAWPLAALGATLVYLCVTAVEMTIREREQSEGGESR